MKIRKILLPLDGSQDSESALPFALALAQRWLAEVIVVRVLNPVFTGWGAGLGTGSGIGLGSPYLFTTVLASQDAAVTAYLDKQLVRFKGVSARTLKPMGDPADMLVQIAREEDCDLVVMAASGHSGMSRWLLGSVTEATLRRISCPMLIVRPSASVPLEAAFRQVLVPCDGSEASTSILGSLEDYLAPDSQVTLLRASGMHASDYCDIVEPQAILSFLGELEADLRLHKIPHREAVYLAVDGAPAVAILAQAEQDKPDLIAMSTHGYRGFQHLFVGSVTEKVARHAACCVLAFRPVSKESLTGGAGTATAGKTA